MDKLHDMKGQPARRGLLVHYKGEEWVVTGANAAKRRVYLGRADALLQWMP
jgi:hypothetical protein